METPTLPSTALDVIVLQIPDSFVCAFIDDHSAGLAGSQVRGSCFLMGLFSLGRQMKMLRL